MQTPNSSSRCRPAMLITPGAVQCVSTLIVQPSWSTVPNPARSVARVRPTMAEVPTSSPLCRYYCGLFSPISTRAVWSSVRRSLALAIDAVRDSAGETGKRLSIALPSRPALPAASCIDNTQPTDYRPGSKDKRRQHMP